MKHTPLNQTRRARWVVLGLLLSWGAAFASPFVNPVQLHIVCSTAGLELIAQTETPGEDGVPQASGHDCAACLPVGLPPAGACVLPDPQLPHARALVSAHASAPVPPNFAPPARGPPPFPLDHS